jgi:hypothetical protein
MPTRKRERHVDEQMGLMVAAAVCCVFVIGLIGAGWFARGLYEDRVAKQIVKRLCQEGVLCAELAD